MSVPRCADEIDAILLNQPWLAFLNTTIIPPGADGVWVVEEATAEYVRRCLSMLAHHGLVDFGRSHIGHESTAAIASELFFPGSAPLLVDRTPWDGKGVGVALQVRGRPQEGKILTRAEVEKLGYTVRVLFRRAAVGDGSTTT